LVETRGSDHWGDRGGDKVAFMRKKPNRKSRKERDDTQIERLYLPSFKAYKWDFMKI
jgi:hypothetical protein